MEFIDVLEKRRSIRKYNTKEILKEDIDKIIHAGTLAPSAHFREPWEVIVLKDKKNYIVEKLREYGSLHLEDQSILRTADIILECDTLLLVYCNNFEQEEYNILSIGAMIENMLLEATNLRISSLWIGNICPIGNVVNEYLQIDSNKKRLVSAVALGYSSYIPKNLKRKTVSEITTYIDC